MTKVVEQITVLVSNPGDMSQHAKLVVEKVNNVGQFLVSDGYVLRAINWHADLTPGVGVDGQDVVNMDLVEQADIIVALFGARIGSKTTNEISGTVEEIYRIRKASENRFGPHSVQTYFYDSELPLSEVDIDDLIKIRDLKERLKKDDILFSEYKNIQGLLESVERGIRKSISHYKEGSIYQNVASDDFESDLGFYEAQDQIIEIMQSFGGLLAGSGEYLNQFAPKIVAVTDQFSADLPAARQKELLNEAAEEMTELADKLNQNGSKLNDSFQDYEECALLLFDVIEEVKSVSGEEIDTVKIFSSLISLDNSIEIAVEKVNRFREVVYTLPRLTRNLNKSKRSLISAVDVTLNAIISFSNMNKRVIERVASIQS